MAAKKIIVVVGATGQQGGSVVKSFLSLPSWHVRAVTRNPSSEAAQELESKGAELVKADLEDPASLTAAFAGAHAIFLNTDFWHIYYPLKAELEAKNEDPVIASHRAFDNETLCGKNAVVAAAAVPTLERIVYSGLGSADKGSGGKYPRALHTEAKSWIVDYITNGHPELAEKLSVIYLGAYNTNRLLQPMPDAATGVFKFNTPLRKDTVLPTIDQRESTGLFVRALIEDEAPGIRLLAYDSSLTVEQVIDTWTKVSGKPAEYVYTSTKQLRETISIQYEHLDSIDQAAEFGYCVAVKDLIEPSQLKNKPVTQSLEEWLRKQS